MAVIVNTKTTLFLCHVLTDSVTSFLLWSQTNSWFFAFFLLLWADCIPLLIVCHLYFLHFICFLFWWFITVHWSLFKKPIYLHLRGSGPLHDETKIWRCNPNHRQLISPTFHKSLAKYDDYFTECSCSRCQNFQFGNQMVFGNMWTLQCSWLPTRCKSWRNVNCTKICFLWISTIRETSMIQEIQTFCECRVSAESMLGGNYSMPAPTCWSAVGKTLQPMLLKSGHSDSLSVQIMTCIYNRCPLNILCSFYSSKNLYKTHG